MFLDDEDSGLRAAIFSASIRLSDGSVGIGVWEETLVCLRLPFVDGDDIDDDDRNGEAAEFLFLLLLGDVIVVREATTAVGTVEFIVGEFVLIKTFMSPYHHDVYCYCYSNDWSWSSGQEQHDV